MAEITARDLKALLDSGQRPVLLDVRQDWETKLCRLENSVHIPIEEIELRTEELDPKSEIVVYCHQGVRSAVNLLGATPATGAAVDNTPERGGKLAPTP